MSKAKASLAARLGAATAPALKGAFSQRVWRRLTRGDASLVSSNLGIDRGVRWRIPVARHELAFGRPADNLGERGALAAIHAFAARERTFIDVGANWGLYTVWAARLFERVIAIEPDPTLAAMLVANIAANRLHATVVQAAVSDARGQARFFKNRDDDAMGSLLPVYSDSHALEPIDVSVLTLRDVLEDAQVSRAVLKIDVEGHGGAVWRGLIAAEDRVEAFVLEITGPEAGEGVPRQIIEHGGWYAYYMADYALRPSARGEFDYVAPFWNWLFTRLDPAALAARLENTPLWVAGH